MKKFLYFLLFLFILSLGFFLYWYFSQKGSVPKIPFLGDNPFGIFGRDRPTPGGGGTLTPDEEEANNGTTTIELPDDAAFFEKVWGDPVAGYTFSDFVTYGTDDAGAKTVATTTAILFVDRGSGHIYKKMLFVPKSTPFKVTNTTLPGIYDAYFYNNNSSVLMRYLRETDSAIISVIGKLPPLSASVTLPLQEVRRLPENIASVAVSPDGTLYYLLKTGTGSSLYRLTGSTEEKVHDYDLSELTLSFNKNSLIVAQKPSAFEKTYFFPQNESDLYGGRTGQRAVFSHVVSGSYISSLWTDVGLQLFSSDTKGGKVHVFSSVTLADKCASSHLGEYFFCFVPNVIPLIPFGLPDDWYKGQVMFNDSLFVLDTVQYQENKLSRLETDTSEEMDVVKPLVSNDDKYLAFMNKLVPGLWVAHIERLLQR